MNGRTAPLPQVGSLSSENASTDQRSHVPDRPSRALFATQSATHFDLPRGPQNARSLPSASADPVDPFDCDQIAFDDVHDPVPAHAQSQHVCPPERLRRIRIPGRASNPSITACMLSASSRNREAVVTALGDHSTLTGPHQAAAAAPPRVRSPRAAQPPTTPGTLPAPLRSLRPLAPAQTPTALAPAAAGTQPPGPPQQPHRPDESPHTGRRRLTRQAVHSCDHVTARARHFRGDTRPRRRRSPVNLQEQPTPGLSQPGPSLVCPMAMTSNRTPVPRPVMGAFPPRHPNNAAWAGGTVQIAPAANAYSCRIADNPGRA